MTDLDDLTLLKRSARGDDGAFHSLYDRYRVPIYNYILRLVRQKGAAEELLQETFLAIWQSAAKFRGKSSVKTWIFRIAYYQSISHLRKSRDVADITTSKIRSSEPAPEDVFLQNFTTSQVLAALEMLSPNQRSVVELTFIYGFSYREIAEIMNCPTGTVKSRMSYALRYLRAALRKMDQN
ncbi:MAG TPA: sigma-70 family RNA polymerase sigma factor [Anaerolineales bacterium]|nr:sigma-70 family RNA polymerase sigma factor [Anaerolineales bacterium]